MDGGNGTLEVGFWRDLAVTVGQWDRTFLFVLFLLCGLLGGFLVVVVATA